MMLFGLINPAYCVRFLLPWASFLHPSFHPWQLDDSRLLAAYSPLPSRPPRRDVSPPSTRLVRPRTAKSRLVRQHKLLYLVRQLKPLYPSLPPSFYSPAPAISLSMVENLDFYSL